jgi:hypothetical protein
MSKKIGRGDYVWIVECRNADDDEWLIDRAFSSAKKAKRHVLDCEGGDVTITAHFYEYDGRRETYMFLGQVDGEDFDSYRVRRYLFDV